MLSKENLKKSPFLFTLFLLFYPAYLSAADLAAFRLKPLKDTVILLSALSGLPLDTRKDAAHSFWSSHSSVAFASAVATGYIFQQRHPGSRFVKPVWIFGLSCASATGMLRVRAGKHFPTDVLAGAAVGTVTGWIVPRMHRETNQRFSLVSEVNGTHGFGIVYSF